MLLPLLNMLIFTTVFKRGLRFHVERYAVYALRRHPLWNFFHQSVISAMNSLARNASILKKLPVPKPCSPWPRSCRA